MQRDAAIQRFEYSFEAVPRAAAHFLRDVEGVIAGSPKAIVRASLRTSVLTAEQATRALEMVDDRNETVHTYNEEVAITIYTKLQGHVELLDAWLTAMTARNEPPSPKSIPGTGGSS